MTDRNDDDSVIDRAARKAEARAARYDHDDRFADKPALDSARKAEARADVAVRPWRAVPLLVRPFEKTEAGIVIEGLMPVLLMIAALAIGLGVVSCALLLAVTGGPQSDGQLLLAFAPFIIVGPLVFLGGHLAMRQNRRAGIAYIAIVDAVVFLIVVYGLLQVFA